MSCLVGMTTIDNVICKLNEIYLNELIMTDPIFNGMDTVSLLKYPLAEKANLVHILTGIGRPDSILTEDGEIIPNFIPHYIVEKPLTSCYFL